jgi:uncharacterized protein (DUF362 family)
MNTATTIITTIITTSRAMKRRDFLKRAGSTLAVASAVGAGGWLLHNRKEGHPPTILFDAQTDYTVAPDKNLPQVTLSRNADPTLALVAALEAMGGIARFVAAGDKVVLKPNVAWDREMEQAANTHPALVAEMVRLCLAAGAQEVVVTDVTCNDARRTFLRSGVKEAAEKAGARVHLPEESDYTEVALKGEFMDVWPVLNAILKADKVINMPIAKHHSLAACTLGMKNLYGIVGGRRNQLHQRIDQSIVDLARFSPPTLTVIDATRVLLRSGPQGGSTDDVALPETVLCATDMVAGDSRACEFIGLTGDQVGHIALAHQQKLGNINYLEAGFKEVTS